MHHDCCPCSSEWGFSFFTCATRNREEGAAFCLRGALWAATFLWLWRVHLKVEALGFEVDRDHH
eukprot:SAG11_NODE_34925_length_269_cov_0.900000_1_plen_64_part_00